MPKKGRKKTDAEKLLISQKTREAMSRPGMKEKLSEAHKGFPAWNRGKKHSEETREKISKALKGKQIRLGAKLSEETKAKMSEARKGKKRTPESRLKQGVSRIGMNSGKDSNLWKGGISSENNKIRNSREYSYWRRSCFERDVFTCQATKQHGGSLVVHHINNFADFPELRFDIDNGITLSKEIHNKFHSMYGKKNNTREQLEEFLNFKE